jgi:hypothetical protein
MLNSDYVNRLTTRTPFLAQVNVMGGQTRRYHYSKAEYIRNTLGMFSCTTKQLIRSEHERKFHFLSYTFEGR